MTLKPSPFNPTIAYQDLRNQATNFTPRKPQAVILHYTALGPRESLRALTEGGVSAHYLVHPDGTIDYLIDESQRAWHAGTAQWGPFNDINSLSIGIEMVGFGFWNEIPEKMDVAPDNLQRVPGSPQEWFPYPLPQIQAVATLCQDLKARWHIKDTLFLGHSDVAPGRKVDPGPLFPWQHLAKDFGVGAWVDSPLARPQFIKLPPKESEVLWMQMHLKQFGYNCPIHGELDPASIAVIQAFQMHYRPLNISGCIDQETIQLLALLLERHCFR